MLKRFGSILLCMGCLLTIEGCDNVQRTDKGAAVTFEDAAKAFEQRDEVLKGLSEKILYLEEHFFTPTPISAEFIKK